MGHNECRQSRKTMLLLHCSSPSKNNQTTKQKWGIRRTLSKQWGRYTCGKSLLSQSTSFTADCAETQCRERKSCQIRACDLSWNSYKAGISHFIASKNQGHCLCQRSRESLWLNQEQYQGLPVQFSVGLFLLMHQTRHQKNKPFKRPWVKSCTC